MRYLIFLLFLSSSTVHSAQCYVKSGEVIDSNGKKIDMGGVLDHCQGVTRKAVVCFENRLEQTICEDVQNKFDLSKSLGDLSKARSSQPLLQAIISLFKPAKTEFYGGKRLKESEYLAGFPNGEVLLPADTLQFSTSEVFQSNMITFALYEKGGNDKPVFATSQIAKTIEIPARTLRPGVKYRWSAQVNETKYSGRFSIAQQQDQRDFEQELNEIQSKSDSSASTRHLLRAVLAKEYGFTFDMQQSLEAARDAMKHGG